MAAPPRPAKPWMVAATATAPANATSATGVPVQPSRTTAKTAAALAPRLMPRTSGLASGLRSIDWNAAPADANAAPARTAMQARGSVDSMKMKDAPGMVVPVIIRMPSTNDTR